VYGDTIAVDGISFDVSSNEIVGLLGLNSVGKTTTINMILGVLQPNSRTIRIEVRILRRGEHWGQTTNCLRVRAREHKPCGRWEVDEPISESRFWISPARRLVVCPQLPRNPARNALPPTPVIRPNGGNRRENSSRAPIPEATQFMIRWGEKTRCLPTFGK